MSALDRLWEIRETLQDGSRQQAMPALVAFVEWAIDHERSAESTPPLAEGEALREELDALSALALAYRDLDRELTRRCPELSPAEFAPIQEARNRVAAALHRFRFPFAAEDEAAPEAPADPPLPPGVQSWAEVWQGGPRGHEPAPPAPEPDGVLHFRAAPEAPAGEPETEGREAWLLTRRSGSLWLSEPICIPDRGDRVEPGRWYPEHVARRLEREAGELRAGLRSTMPAPAPDGGEDRGDE
jgi:hypothetical protein